MGSVGPRLPPSSVEKRRREDSGDDSSTPPPASEKRSPSPESAAKRPRIIGPSLPPSSSHERAVSGSESDSSDNDDFGPSLPTAENSTAPSLEDEKRNSLDSIRPQI